MLFTNTGSSRTSLLEIVRLCVVGKQISSFPASYPSPAPMEIFPPQITPQNGLCLFWGNLLFGQIFWHGKDVLTRVGMMVHF